MTGTPTYGPYGSPPKPGGHRPPRPTAYVPAGIELAGRGARLAARIIDWGICALIIAVIVLVYAIAVHNLDVFRNTRTDALVTCAVLLSYEWGFLGLNGATPGKALLHIRVVSTRGGSELGARRAFYRTLYYFGMATSCCLGLLDPLWCLWDKPLRQCLHDKRVRSVVVRSR